MKDETKVGYIAGGVFLLVGILMTFVGLDTGWSSGKIVIVIGLILDLLGIGGLLKPDSVGSVLAHYLKNVADNQGRKTYKQYQKHSKNSPQAYTERGHVIQNFYGSNKKRRRKY